MHDTVREELVILIVENGRNKKRAEKRIIEYIQSCF